MLVRCRMSLVTSLEYALANVDSNKRKLGGLSSGIALLLHNRWMRLVEEGKRLRSKVSQGLYPVLGSLMNDIEGNVVVGCRLAEKCNLRYGRRGASQQTLRTPGQAGLRLGMGPPGYTGCLNVDGSAINWQIFNNHSTGIFAAMDKLDLDIIGLPGGPGLNRLATPMQSG